MRDHESRLSVGTALLKLSAIREDIGDLRTRSSFLLEGVVGRPHQGARFDVFEAHFLAQALEFGKFVRMDKAVDRKMFGRWL